MAFYVLVVLLVAICAVFVKASVDWDIYRNPLRTSLTIIVLFILCIVATSIAVSIS